jgi:peptide/nickel transport system substrate-binding protein
MRLKKPMIVVTTAAFLALAACGGGDGGGPSGDEPTAIGEGGGAGAGKDPNREAPAPEIEGAQTGGTLKVISVNGLNTMDPTEAYYTNTSSILSGLVTRSLTQYVYDETAKDMILIPDIATDLGTPNDDYTEWTYTIRPGVKYENGQEVTAEDIAYGIKRSFDRSTFPEGAAYSNEYFLDGDTYEGPYTSGDQYAGVVVNGDELTIKMATPFPDMPYWGAFPAIGPIPPGKDSDPAKYALHPWATGPYMFGDYTPEKSLTLVKNPEWDPNTDPGRHQYVDQIEMEFDTPTAKIDQTMLADSGDAKNTLSYDNVTVADYLPFKQDSEDRLVIGTVPCTGYWAPDYRKITDIKVRQALAWAYPYADTYAARGYIENVTMAYGTNLMPPGIPGRTEYNPLPDHEAGATDPDKARALLEEADAVGYEIKFLYSADDPLRVDEKDAIVKGLEAAGFKATPIATTVDQSSTLRADPN